MSTANDFLQKLQSATVKSTVQQKQKSRPNASAAELSKMLMAATGQGESVLPETTSVTQMPVQEKKSHEAVKEKSGAADLSDKKAAASSFLQESVVRQEMSTQQKEKKTKLPLSESKENGDAGIASLIQKALAAKEKMQQAVPVMERVGGLRSEFEAVFQPQAEAMKEENGFISTASFRRTKEKEGHLNVAAYIRVSTDSSDQENSYETQERYFHQLIENNPDWNPIGVYSDYGISGTVKDKRVGFKRLLRHCREGKIDRIVCKSISRFSRNTADFMTALNILHDNNVTILFEKENLDTADPTSDFILTTLAAIAQEESRSISRNINLGNKMRYPRGEVKNMVIYGYRYNGKMVTTESGYQYRDIEIVEEEAKIVRRIFQEVAEGTAYTDVARGLNYDRIPAPETVAVKARKKNSKKGQLNSDLEEGWTGRIISQMIQRERYTGAVLIQKKYTVDFLNHNIQRNNGELPQYLVKNHHPAIIDEELFETVQEIRRANAAQKEKGVKKGSKPFSGRILCGECGRFFRVRNSKHYPVWFCPTAEIYNGKRICHTERVYEEQIVRAFRKAIIERFRLSAQPIHDNVEVADIMSGRYGEQFEGFTKEADDFVPQMIKRLENIQHTDFMERDRAFYKRQIATLQIGMESSGKKLRLLESQNDVMQTRRELLGDESIDEAVIQSNAEKIRRLKEKLDRDMDEKKHLEERLEYLEGYWEDLENDHERRERAIEWMKELPKGRDGLTGNDIGTSFYHADYEEGSEIEAYASLAKDIRQRIESFRKEKETLSQEQGALTVMKKNFDLFIACLKELPEQNAAGMPLKVNGLDVQGSLFRDVDGKPVDGAVASLNRGRLKMTPERIAEAPDLLHFEKGIYCAFMKKGTVKGDIVLYETNFGVTLPTCGNQRTLTSFLGFKKCSLDGLVTLVDAPYRVYDNTVQYRRYLRSKAKREQAV